MENPSVKKTTLVVAALLAALFVSGCSKKQEANGTQSTATTGSTSSGSTLPSVSPYDHGPRASESPIDEALAKQGEGLFQTKGCSACHGFGKRISCPDLDGVATRRTALWMEHQILHPEKMTKEDPIAHQLFAQFSLQMPNQGLTLDQTRAVIEFLKHKNHEAAESHK